MRGGRGAKFTHSGSTGNGKDEGAWPLNTQFKSGGARQDWFTLLLTSSLRYCDALCNCHGGSATTRAVLENSVTSDALKSLRGRGDSEAPAKTAVWATVKTKSGGCDRDLELMWFLSSSTASFGCSG